MSLVAGRDCYIRRNYKSFGSLFISVLVQNLARGDIESPPGSVHGVSNLLLVGLDVAHTMKLAGFYETGEIQGPEHQQNTQNIVDICFGSKSSQGRH